MPRAQSNSLDTRRKKLKCLYFSARDNKFPHMLRMNKRDDTFKLLIMNKRNKKWNKTYLDLFKALDDTDKKNAAKFRKSEKYDSECKHRCLQNITKMCNEGLLKVIDVINVKESIKVLHIKFLYIPDSWRDINNTYEMSLFGGEQEMEMSYLNSPSVNNSVVPHSPTNFPLEDDVFLYDNVVLPHVLETKNEGSGNIPPTSEVQNTWMVMSYLYLPIASAESIADAISTVGNVSMQPLINSNENVVENISPTSEVQNTWMEMSYLNPQSPGDSSLGDSTSTTESVSIQDFENSNESPDENMSYSTQHIEDNRSDCSYSDVSNLYSDPEAAKRIFKNTDQLLGKLNSLNLTDWHDEDSPFLREDSQNKVLNWNFLSRNNAFTDGTDTLFSY